MQGVLFDDFDYLSSNDPNFLNMGWTIREGGGNPGVAGCSWSKDNVTFVDDPRACAHRPGNRLLRILAKTNGTGAGTSQAELYHQRKFFEGSYAARVKFYDTPVLGPDGDAVVETFFTITLGFEGNDNYSELDFEYLPHGGWDTSEPTFYQTTWIKVNLEPAEVDRIFASQRGSLDGWHTLVCNVKDGHVKYYIDGNILVDHTDKYYPKAPMSINFNLWFIDGKLLDSFETRIYQQDVDWVLFVQDEILSTEAVNEMVDKYRKQHVTRLDTVALQSEI